jgi:MFS family permease
MNQGHFDLQSSYRWVIVATGAVMTCVALGAMFSLAIFLEPMSTTTGWSRAGISTAMTLNFLIMGAGGLAWGAVSDRCGARIVVLIGAVLLGSALFLASRVTSLTQFQLTYGILVGAAASTFFAPMIAATMAWFDDKHRAIAVSLVSVGVGVAPMTISPLARWLISTYDWRTAMLLIGILAWTLLIPAALLVRSPKSVQPIAGAPPRPATNETSLSVRDALRSPQFLILGFTFFACCAAHSGPIFHMVSYAIFCGVAPMAAVSIYSMEGLAGLGGRLLLGWLADRYGAKAIIVLGLAVQAVAIGAYTVVNRLGEFYLLATIFGAAYGGVMPLYAVLARDYFGQRILGTVFGAATMLSCLGMAFGPLVGGWIFDSFANYRWLFLGSCAVGVGAVAIALAFPRTRAQSLQPALAP